jgi:hypothetical protein
LIELSQIVLKIHLDVRRDADDIQEAVAAGAAAISSFPATASLSFLLRIMN